MSLKGEALVLRDEICASAPEALKQAVGDDKWTIAMLSAEAYFKARQDRQETSMSLVYPKENTLQYYFNLYDEDYRVGMGIYTMYKSGKPVSVIASAFDMSELRVIGILQFAYSTVFISSNLKELNDIAIYCTDDRKRLISDDYIPMAGTYDILDEVAVRIMLKVGASTGDIAAKYGLSVADVVYLRDKGDIDFDALCMETAVVQDWMRGKTPMFIAEKYERTVDEVLRLLRHSGYVTAGADRSINVARDAEQTDIHLTSSEYSNAVTKRNVTLPPMIDSMDMETVNKFRNCTMYQLQAHLGCKDSNISELVKEFNNAKYPLNGEYVEVVQ